MEPDCIFTKKFDYILISMESQNTAEKVKEWLSIRGIEDEKLIRVL